MAIYFRSKGQIPLTREEEYVNMLDDQLEIEREVLEGQRRKYDELNNKYLETGDAKDYDKVVNILKQINSRELSIMKKEDKLNKLLDLYKDPYTSGIPYRDTKPKSTVHAILGLLALGALTGFILLGILSIIFLVL